MEKIHRNRQKEKNRNAKYVENVVHLYDLNNDELKLKV